MARGLHPHIFVFLLLPLALAQGENLPEFSLLVDGIAQSSAPSIQVQFPDGETDKLILWDHFFNEEDRLSPKTGLPKSSQTIFILQNVCLSTVSNKRLNHRSVMRGF